ncbi:MAG: molybdopterin molybdotransferase MoeA [Sphingomicrobium sp.]
MINFDEAVALIRGVAVPVGRESIALEVAAGRVLATPVIARIDSPRNDVSAMDGYAVRSAELGSGPVSLKIVGGSLPGEGWAGKLGSGECARIFTGAPVPNGADRVIVQEIVRREGDMANFDATATGSTNIRRRGGDFAIGEELLPAGRRLDPRALVAAAAADVDRLDLFRRPRVQIISTGDELVEPGTAAIQDNAIPESASFGVAALAEDWGARVEGRLRLSDDLAQLKSAAERALANADLVIVTGGASVGERDFAKSMFDDAGLKLIFSKVDIKPGKPVWLGRVGDTIVIGLPGNPTSALVTARLFLAPVLAGITGRTIEDALQWRRLPLATPLPACGQRETFHRARSVSGAAEILSFQDSSAQKVLAEADLLVRQPANTQALEVGSIADVLDF